MRETLDLLARVLGVAQAAGLDGTLLEAGLVRGLAYHPPPPGTHAAHSAARLASTATEEEWSSI